MVPNTLAFFIGLFLASVNAGPRSCRAGKPRRSRKPEQRRRRRQSGSAICEPMSRNWRCRCWTCRPRDEGVAGANVALADNNTTRQVHGPEIHARRHRGEARRRRRAGRSSDMVAKGDRYVLTDISAKQLPVDRRHRPRQWRAAVQCRRHRRHPARGGVPGERLPHRADAQRCWPTGWRNT